MTSQHIERYLKEVYLPNLNLDLEPADFVQQCLELTDDDQSINMRTFYKMKISPDPVAKQQYEIFIQGIKEPTPPSSPSFHSTDTDVESQTDSEEDHLEIPQLNAEALPNVEHTVNAKKQLQDNITREITRVQAIARVLSEEINKHPEKATK